MNRLLTLAIGICATLAASVALGSADMRCGTKLITQGMTKDEVLEICDTPTSTEKFGTVWVYDQGDAQFLKVITFVNDEVEFIDDRSRETMKYEN